MELEIDMAFHSDIFSSHASVGFAGMKETKRMITVSGVWSSAAVVPRILWEHRHKSRKHRSYVYKSAQRISRSKQTAHWLFMEGIISCWIFYITTFLTKTGIFFCHLIEPARQRLRSTGFNYIKAKNVQVSAWCTFESHFIRSGHSD